MVSDQEMDHAAGGASLFFEIADQVQDLLGEVAPVQDVAGLDEVGLAANPAISVIAKAGFLDKAGSLENEDEIIEVAV